MSGGGGGSTTTTELAPELRPLASEYTRRAIDLSSNQFTPYTGQRFAGLTPDQQAGLGMIRQRAGGSPISQAADTALIQNLRGGQENPYLDQLVQRSQRNLTDQYANVIRPQQDAMMARSGSFGNTGAQMAINAQQNQLLGNLGDISTQMYGQAYDQDRARQMQALGLAPSVSNLGYQDAAQLMQAGQLQQNLGQQQADFAYEQFQDRQNQPYRNLQILGAPFSQGFGGVTTTSGGGK